MVSKGAFRLCKLRMTQLRLPHPCEKFQAIHGQGFFGCARNWVIGNYAANNLCQDANGTNQTAMELH